MQNADDLGTVLPGAGLEPAGYDPDPSPRGARRRDPDRDRRRRRRGRRSLVLLVALALVGGAAFGAYSALRPVWEQLTAENDYAGGGTTPVKVTIAQGASTTTIARTLANADVVKSTTAFVEAAGKDPRARQIQPGRYTLRKQMSGASALALLLNPKARDVRRVLLREGLRQAQVVALLAKASGRPAVQYTRALAAPAALGLPAVAHGRAEGWLFPDSYEFGSETTPTEQLRTMVSRTKAVLAELKVPAGRQQALLTEASIVQAEAGSTEDMGKIARVLDNRLADGTPLQLDTTVNYANGKSGITTTAADRANPSPYNTYMHPGLPPGPIGSPGEDALRAVLAPTQGDWRFFVVVDPSTGETLFATTAEEHQQNVAKFRQWLRAHPQG
jgi:UPF0755 protein